MAIAALRPGFVVAFLSMLRSNYFYKTHGLLRHRPALLIAAPMPDVRFHDIAVVTPMWLEYSSQLTEGARSYAREQRDLRVVVLPLQQYGQSPLPRNTESFSGLLVLANEMDRWVEDLWRRGLPVVNCSGDLPAAQIPSVTPQAIFGTAVDYLAGLGRRELALVCPDLEKNPGYQPLVGSFAGIVRERGLSPHVFAKCQVDPGDSPSRLFEAEQEEELADFLEGLPKPAGVWCVHDELAALVCEVARLKKLAIPRALAVLGVGDTRVARFTDPPISSIPLPGRAVGYEGMTGPTQWCGVQNSPRPNGRSGFRFRRSSSADRP